jgi:hypothetical protein
MKQMLIVLLAVALTGCAPKNKVAQDGKPDVLVVQPNVTEPEPELEPAKPTAGEAESCTVPEMESCKAQLQAVAGCFHEAVTLLQKEPGEKGLAQFLSEAANDVPEGDVMESCAPLGLNATCDALLLSSGDEVKWEKKDSSHDNFGDGEVFHILYTFTASGCPDGAEIEIQLQIGDVL